MTPETVQAILGPLLKHFHLPHSLRELLKLLLLIEIERGYPSLNHNPQYDRRDPRVRLAEGLNLILSRLPKIYELDDHKLYASLEQLAALTDQDVRSLHALSTPMEYYHYHERRRSLKEDINWLQFNIDRSSRDETVHTRRLLREARDELKELKEPENAPYLSSFWSRLLSLNVSFDIPKRNRHCHIIGASGTGKTTLIKKLIYQDIQSGVSVIAMAPKGDLIETAAQFPSDRAIWIKDWSQVGLSLSDLSPKLIVYVFEALLEAEPTPMQKAFLIKHIPKITSLNDLQHLKVEKLYEETFEKHIKWRLDLMPKAIDQILSRPTNINIQHVMDSGQVLLLDTKYLDDGSSFIGRFVLALIARATPRRTAKNFVAIYVDEAQLFITEYMEQLLDTAREANVGLTLAHQDLSQISPRLASSLHNAATKFIGKCNHSDAAAFARELLIEPSALQQLPDYTFMVSAFKKPFPIHITPLEFTATQREHFVSPRLEVEASHSPQTEEDPGTKAWK